MITVAIFFALGTFAFKLATGFLERIVEVAQSLTIVLFPRNVVLRIVVLLLENDFGLILASVETEIRLLVFTLRFRKNSVILVLLVNNRLAIDIRVGSGPLLLPVSFYGLIPRKKLDLINCRCSV